MARDITTDHLILWLEGFARRIAAGRHRLNELDAATGDADHGTNLDRGAQAVGQMIGQTADHGTPGAFLKAVGLAVVGSVGGSSGALYGTIFLRMAATVGPQVATIDGATMARALHAAVQGIVDRGRARAGDKTMFDALEPAARAFDSAIAAGQGSNAAWQAASIAAEAGAAATAAMRARRGKSSYVGDRSIGSVDPGAASLALLIAAGAEAMAHI